MGPSNTHPPKTSVFNTMRAKALPEGREVLKQQVSLASA